MAITFEHREQFLSYMPSMLLEKFVFSKISSVGIKLGEKKPGPPISY